MPTGWPAALSTALSTASRGRLADVDRLLLRDRPPGANPLGWRCFQLGLLLLPSSALLAALLLLVALIQGSRRRPAAWRDPVNALLLATALLMLLGCFGASSGWLAWLGLGNWLPFFWAFWGFQAYLASAAARLLSRLQLNGASQRSTSMRGCQRCSRASVAASTEPLSTTRISRSSPAARAAAVVFHRLARHCCSRSARSRVGMITVQLHRCGSCHCSVRQPGSWLWGRTAAMASPWRCRC